MYRRLIAVIQELNIILFDKWGFAPLHKNKKFLHEAFFS